MFGYIKVDKKEFRQSSVLIDGEGKKFVFHSVHEILLSLIRIVFR